MTKTKSFKCPSCGAPLEYDGGEVLTVRCPFCSNAVIVPEELRRPGGLPPASASPAPGQPTDPAQIRAAIRETKREARAKRKALRHQLHEMRHR
jgi:DNA-directed RNA polymerase subunit RPC12/RpoP